jgi:ribosomal-protein-serine acetyltransferase
MRLTKLSPAALRGRSAAEAVEWATSRARFAAGGGELTFASADSNGRFLDGCGVNQINRTHRFGNLGYWVRTSAAGRGVASEAARQMADFAFRHTDLVRLKIVCAVENRRSQRVAAGVLGARFQSPREPDPIVRNDVAACVE